MVVSSKKDVEMSKSSIRASYKLIVKKAPDPSVITDLETHLTDSCTFCGKLKRSIAHRSNKYNPCGRMGLVLSARQIRTDRMQKDAVLWFKAHNVRVRRNVAELKEILKIDT